MIDTTPKPIPPSVPVAVTKGDIIQAIRNELAPLKAKIEELTKAVESLKKKNTN